MAITAPIHHPLDCRMQVTVALYVFCKSGPPSADKRLHAAAILLFIPGVFQFFEKPLALKSASYNSLVSSLFASDKISRTKTTNREVELEEYIQKARDFVKRNKYPPELDYDGARPHLSLSVYLISFSQMSYAPILTVLLA